MEKQSPDKDSTPRCTICPRKDACVRECGENLQWTHDHCDYDPSAAESMHIPYKDIPQEDLIKAIHLMFTTISDILIHHCTVTEQRLPTLIKLMREEYYTNQKEISSLLRSRPGACIYPEAPSSTASSSPALHLGYAQSDPQVSPEPGKDC